MSGRRENGSLTESPTREQILAAARRIFQSIGYVNCTVEDIRKEAGVSKATFYFYFSNKDDIFTEVANELTYATYDRLSLKHFQEQDAYSRIVSANTMYIGRTMENRRILDDYFALSLTSDAFLEAYGRNTRKFQGRLERHISRLVDEGVISGLDPRLTATALIGMVQMLCLRYFRETEIVGAHERTLLDLLRTASASWYRLLYGKNEPAEFDYSPYVADLERLAADAAKGAS